MKALVVDDSRAIRLIVGRILKEIGFEVVEADNGKVALDRLAEGSFDVALVDWNMPVMDGYEFLVAVQGAANRPRHVVMVTTETEADRMTRALEAGASEYVMKPFTKDTIVGKLAMLGIGVG